jgi:hypothetical protein
VDVQQLLLDAEALGLFHSHPPFEVHCAHCHARLNGKGDCATCGLIGRPRSEIDKRATVDPAGTMKLLSDAIDRRKAFKPAGREKNPER